MKEKWNINKNDIEKLSIKFVLRELATFFIHSYTYTYVYVSCNTEYI